MQITFEVLGDPAPQGSKSFKGLSRSGKAILTESCPRVKPWRDSVAWTVKEVRQRYPLARFTGPIECTIVFRLRRPKTLPKKIKHHTKKPDLSKLIRSTEDALTNGGILSDDSIIVSLGMTRKTYVAPGESLGATIQITEIE